MLRLTPVIRDGERVHVASLQIVPEPVRRREGKDFFGNVLTWIEIDEPHDTLTVKLQARVAVDAPVEPRWRRRPGKRCARKRSPPAISGRCRRRIFCFRAAWCRSIPRSAITRARALRPAAPVLDAAIELIGRLKADIVYEIGATTVTTMPPMSFALRRGVCQDFAHIMISGLRGLGLPAAYVSGYLRSRAVERRRAFAGQRGHACLGAAMVRRRRRLGWA